MRSVFQWIKSFVYVHLYLNFWVPIKYRCDACKRNKIEIMNPYRTLETIAKNKVSLSRYGDGEIHMVAHFFNEKKTVAETSFQNYDEQLAKRLHQILYQGSSRRHMVGIPYSFLEYDEYSVGTDNYWKRVWVEDCSKMFDRIFNSKSMYCDSTFTRFYIDRNENYRKEVLPNIIQMLKRLWDDQDVCIIEGALTRLGVGNDLFDNCKSIRRIIAPSTNAFTKMEEILQEAVKQDKSVLFLIALGHTATILAYDLAMLGYWAIDIGHVDVEYEWYLMGVQEKTPLTTKYVNEVPDGKNPLGVVDSTYDGQIISRIN